MLRAIKYTLLLLVIILSSCTSKKKEDKSDLAEQGKQAFKSALAAEKQGNFLESIHYYDVAIGHYSELDSLISNYLLYLSHRFKGNMLNKVKMPGLAAESVANALPYLAAVDSLPANKTKNAERTSSLSYMADYLRRDGQYQASNDILIGLLGEKEQVKHSHIQFKNLIGLNFIDLGDLATAYEYFGDILKDQTVDPIKRAHYLNNRSFTAMKLGKKMEAYNDIREAIGIVSALKAAEYEMRFRMYLGEYYYEDGDYAKADESLSLALAAYPQVDDAPDLFKVYNLKHGTALALGLPNALDYKLKYDELLKANLKAVEQYTAEQQLSIVKAQLAQLQIEKERQLWTSSLSASKRINLVTAVLLAVAIGFTMLMVAAWKRKQQRFVG